MSGVCSVRDRCGPTGLACRADDRACQSRATEEGLEILCENTESSGSVYVYCPTGTDTRDSGVVWILLLAAVLIAVIGGAVLAIALRKAPKQAA